MNSRDSGLAKAIRTGVLIASSLVTLAVLAQEAPGVATTAAAVDPAAVAPRIHIPEGTEVPLLFVDPLSSATNDAFWKIDLVKFTLALWHPSQPTS